MRKVKTAEKANVTQVTHDKNRDSDKTETRPLTVMWIVCWQLSLSTDDLQLMTCAGFSTVPSSTDNVPTLTDTTLL